MTEAVEWRKSSFSGHGEEENCIQLALPDGKVRLRESDLPDGIVVLTPDQLGSFIRAIKAGALDHLTA